MFSFKMDECPGCYFFSPQALPVTKRVSNSEILDLLVTGESGIFLEIRLDVYMTILSVKHSSVKTCAHRKCCMMALSGAVRN